MINYAHRGASEYAPENTLSSFYLGLLQGANGIETDVQKTKDGILVLFHDDTLDRVTDHTGKLSDYTWEELKSVKVYGNSTGSFYDGIITLQRFLEMFSQYDIQYALELKGPDVEEDTLNMVKEFDILHKVTFTSFQFDYIRKIKHMDASARVGWLIGPNTENVIHRLQEISAEEIAPQAIMVNADNMNLWRTSGFGVRAWGVTNISLMKKMCEYGVDGMTVNFPDRLRQYLSTIE